MSAWEPVTSTPRPAWACGPVRTGGRKLVFRNEGIGQPRLESMEISTKFTFGIELELFFPSSTDADQIRNAMEAAYLTEWRLDDDSSIQCNPSLPSCYKAELVSPVLRTRNSLRTIYNVLDSIKSCSPSVNKSTGLHVHLRPTADSGWDLPLLRCFCHNFVRLESGFDQLVPNSRRANNNTYCASNALAVMGGRQSRKQTLSKIRNARSIEALKNMVCPSNRYYKLNLRALDRHGTIEIRHPAGSQNASKVVGYVVMYLALAEASMAGRLAGKPKKGYEFENLLQFLSFNHVLLHWMMRRQLELRPKGDCRC